MLAMANDVFGPITQQLIEDTNHRAWGVMLTAGVFGVVGLVTMAFLLFVRVRTKADPMDSRECARRNVQVIAMTVAVTILTVMVCGIFGIWIGDIVAPTLSVFTQFGKVISTQ